MLITFIRMEHIMNNATMDEIRYYKDRMLLLSVEIKGLNILRMNVEGKFSNIRMNDELMFENCLENEKDNFKDALQKYINAMYVTHVEYMYVRNKYEEIEKSHDINGLECFVLYRDHVISALSYVTHAIRNDIMLECACVRFLTGMQT